MIPPTLALSFIFPGGIGNFSIGYGSNLAAPIPGIGELVNSHAGTAYKVTARSWNYDAANALLITIACG